MRKFFLYGALLAGLLSSGAAWPQPLLPAPDGNRLTAGSMDIKKAGRIILSLPGIPVRIDIYSGPEGPAWLVKTGDGPSYLVRADGSGMARAEADIADSGIAGPLPSAYAGADPLSDGQTAVNGKGAVAVLTGNTKKYTHGILGDTAEADGFAVFTPGNFSAPAARFRLDDGGVFETLSPLWFDINRDGIEDIILTRSDSVSGAGITVYDGRMPGGAVRLLARSAPIGRGFRWLHVLAAAYFAPDGVPEIAVVRTPHIGGILEFYRLEGYSLVPVHSRPGFSSHRIGSRNLGMALAGDFSGDGRPDLLLPAQDFRQLNVVTRTAGGSDIYASMDLGAELSTNLAVISSGGRIRLCWGTADNRLFILSSQRAF